MKSSKKLRGKGGSGSASAWLAILTIWLVMLTSCSTASGQSIPEPTAETVESSRSSGSQSSQTTDPPVTPVVRAVTEDGRKLPPGYWISKRDLAMLVTEAETEGKKVRELESVETKTVQEGYSGEALLVGITGGVLCGTLLALTLVATLN